MKKIIIVSFLFSVLIACNDSKDEKKEEATGEKKETVDPDNNQNPDYQKGLSVVAKSGCLTCHKVDEKVTGPAYREVANKYGSYPDTIIAHLAGKIIKGGSGVWGEIPMIAHPTLSEEDAEAAVKYILLLKK